jgi:hypothetical protein
MGRAGICVKHNEHREKESVMKAIKSALIGALCVVMFLSVAAPVWAYEENDYGPPKALDALVLRPMGFFSTILGGAVYLISLPFSASTHSDNEAAQEMVVEPFHYTFKRPLGAPAVPEYYPRPAGETPSW